MAGEPLAERIEKAFHEAIVTRRHMELARWQIQDTESKAKAEHADEWSGAKNNDVRAVLLAGWLSGDEDYTEARQIYRESKLEHRLALLEIERLKLLVALERGA